MEYISNLQTFPQSLRPTCSRNSSIHDAYDTARAAVSLPLLLVPWTPQFTYITDHDLPLHFRNLPWHYYYLIQIRMYAETYIAEAGTVHNAYLSFIRCVCQLYLSITTYMIVS
jgi:hypothetical protein